MGKRSIALKVISFLAVLSIAVSLAACGNASNNTPAGSTAAAPTTAAPEATKDENAPLFDKPVKLSILMGSHASWPYDENWKVWQYVKEATGAELDIQAVPGEELPTKLNLIMASKDKLPDIVHVWAKTQSDAHAMSGAYVSILDNLDKLPNFSKWLDSISDKEEILAQHTAGDGKIYLFPTYGVQTINNLIIWMDRKDILERNNLTVPTTYDELYTVSKKLKEIYPDSYPLSFRGGVTKFDQMLQQWKPYMGTGFYYDFDNKKWNFGGTEDTMKEFILWVKKAYDDKLIPTDFATITNQSWQELVTTNRGFFMPEYIVRIDFFNGPARTTDPDYTWAVMEPPKGNTSTATNKTGKTNLDLTGYLVVNTGKQESMDNALKFVDWFYSDKGKALVSWGKEGETYKVVNSEKQFILDDKGTPARNLYGFGTYGLYQVIDETSNEALYTKENVAEAHKAAEFLEPRSNPINWLPFNESEKEISDQKLTPITNYVNEQLSKFILGQRPISEWDAYVKEVNALGVEELRKAYEDAYSRVTK